MADTVTKQNKFLLRWAEVSIKVATGEQITINGVSDFQNGELLLKLSHALIKKPPPRVNLKTTNKLSVVGNLQNILAYITADDVRITCSATEIYDCNEIMILGLLWVLVLKYQVIQKSDIVNWYANITNQPAATITNLEKHFHDGSGFCNLVNSLRAGSIDIGKLQGNRELLLKAAFETADNFLGVPPILTGDENYMDERSVLTYLSYFYNKYNGAKAEPIQPAEPEVDYEAIINGLNDKIKVLEDELAILRIPKPVDTTEVDKLNEKVKALEEEIKLLSIPKPVDTSENDALREKIKALENQMESLQIEVRQTKAESAEILIKSVNEMNQLKARASDLETELKDTKNQNTIVEKKIAELTLKLPFFINAAQNTIAPPEGVVTLVFTDVQSSTDQWETRPVAMAAALSIHNKLMRELLSKHQGYEVKTEGDAFMIAFASPKNAIKWCFETQLALLKQEWPEDIYLGAASSIEEIDGVLIYKGLRVRMGIHTGEPKAERDPVTARMDYFGPMVNRAARVESVAFGGQIVISGDTYAEIKDSMEELEIEEIKDLGKHRLKGLQTDTQLYQIAPKQLTKRIFPDFFAQQKESKEKEGKEEKEESGEEETKSNIEKSIDKLEKENSELKNRLKELETEIEDAKSKITELDSWLEAKKTAVPDVFLKDFLGVVSNVSNLLQTHSALSEGLGQVKTKNKSNQKSLDSLKGELETAATREQTLLAEVDRLQQEKKELEEQIQQLKNEVEGLKKNQVKKKSKSILQYIKRKKTEVETDLANQNAGTTNPGNNESSEQKTDRELEVPKNKEKERKSSNKNLKSILSKSKRTSKKDLKQGGEFTEEQKNEIEEKGDKKGKKKEKKEEKKEEKEEEKKEEKEDEAGKKEKIEETNEEKVEEPGKKEKKQEKEESKEEKKEKSKEEEAKEEGKKERKKKESKQEDAKEEKSGRKDKKKKGDA